MAARALFGCPHSHHHCNARSVHVSPASVAASSVRWRVPLPRINSSFIPNSIPTGVKPGASARGSMLPKCQSAGRVPAAGH